MVLKAPDSPPAIATVALPVPGPSLCCCPTCRSLPKGASLSPTPSSVFPVPSPWHFHSWREEAEQGENGTCSPRGAQFQPAAHSVRCSGTHVPRQLPGFPLLPPSLLPSGKPSSTAGAEQGGATNGYSWARKGTHGLPPASCALVPGRPDSTARPNPAEPVRRPPPPGGRRREHPGAGPWEAGGSREPAAAGTAAAPVPVAAARRSVVQASGESPLPHGGPRRWPAHGAAPLTLYVAPRAARGRRPPDRGQPLPRTRRPRGSSPAALVGSGAVGDATQELRGRDPCPCAPEPARPGACAQTGVPGLQRSRPGT